MGGVQDKTKRKRVREYLLTKKGREETDRAVARECGVSKVLVASVRRELIAAGRLPFPVRDKHLGERKVYQPGASARGGYVFDEMGRTVQKMVWVEKHEKKPRRRPGRATKKTPAMG